MGQCGISPLSCSHRVVCSPSQEDVNFPPTLLSSSQHHRGVYGHHPHDQMSLLDAMNAGFQDISAEDCQGWIRHAKRFFPRCMALDDIQCDVDENLWPNAEDRVDQHSHHICGWCEFLYLATSKSKCTIKKHTAS